VISSTVKQLRLRDVKCPKHQAEKPVSRKFRHECGAKRIQVCPGCGCEYPPRDKFYGECDHNLYLPLEPIPQDISFIYDRLNPEV
jgi:hypothetical protein